MKAGGRTNFGDGGVSRGKGRSDFSRRGSRNKKGTFKQRRGTLNKLSSGNLSCHLLRHTTRNSVCVTKMAESTTDEDLRNFFKGCGVVGMIYISRYITSGFPYEAVVNFKNKKSVSSAVKFDGSKLLGSRVKVVNLDMKFSVIVTNICRQVTVHQFKNFMSECNLACFRFEARKKNGPKSAFVFLADESGYKQALRLNGKDLNGVIVTIYPSLQAAKRGEVEVLTEPHLSDPKLVEMTKTSMKKEILCNVGAVIESGSADVKYNVKNDLNNNMNKFEVKVVETNREEDGCSDKQLFNNSSDVYSPMITSSMSADSIKEIYGCFGTVTNVLIYEENNIGRISFEAKEQAQAAVLASVIQINGVLVTIHHTFCEALNVIQKLLKRASKKQGLENIVTKEIEEKETTASNKRIHIKKEAGEEGSEAGNNSNKFKYDFESELHVKIEAESVEEISRNAIGMNIKFEYDEGCDEDMDIGQILKPKLVAGGLKQVVQTQSHKIQNTRKRKHIDVGPIPEKRIMLNQKCYNF